MKRLLAVFCTIYMLSFAAIADDSTDVLSIFESYVNAANSYSKTIPNYYTNNAKIIRVVNKKSGGQQSVVIPYDRYLKELSGHSALAKTVKYKNHYTNRKAVKIGKDYKVTALRIPRNDKVGLPCHFIFTKQGNSWKIREESMTTNVQTFLNAK